MKLNTNIILSWILLAIVFGNAIDLIEIDSQDFTHTVFRILNMILMLCAIAGAIFGRNEE